MNPESEKLETIRKKFKILSLDGGGIKGIFSAAFLAYVEEDIGINVTDCFDLITGTSTGGIIAIGLGLGMRPREIVEFYINEGPKIFPGNSFFRFVQHWFFRKYSNEGLVNALKDCFGDKKLGESQKRLVIPSFSLDENDVYLFRTAHHERLRRDLKVPAWKVALATSSAPTFFPCCQEVDQARLVDGGVWANNPVLTGIVEAYGTLKVPLDSISVLSIGTSEDVSNRKKSLSAGGLLSWALTAKDVIMHGQSASTNNHARFLLGEENLFRVNPKVAKGEFALDGVSDADKLIAKAGHLSRILMPKLKENIFANKAEPFLPIHSLAQEGKNDRDL